MNVRTSQGSGGAAGGPSLVRARRLELGLTMARLAERCAAEGTKVSASEISRIERRIHIPRPALRLALAEVLGISVADFDEGEAHA